MSLQWAPVELLISIALTVRIAATMERWLFDGAVPDGALEYESLR